MKKPYYVTTAIAYTSGKPHIGNTYEAILTDAIVRFKRLQGYDVRFQTGTDEHGQKIEEKAEAARVTPQAYVDRVANVIRTIWDGVNVRYDNFIRTTDADHVRDRAEDLPQVLRTGRHLQGRVRGLVLHPVRELLDGEPARRTASAPTAAGR